MAHASVAEQKKLEGIKAYKFGRVLKARTPSSLLAHAQSCFLPPCSTFLSPVLLSRLLLKMPDLSQELGRPAPLGRRARRTECGAACRGAPQAKDDFTDAIGLNPNVPACVPRPLPPRAPAGEPPQPVTALCHSRRLPGA